MLRNRWLCGTKDAGGSAFSDRRTHSEKTQGCIVGARTLRRDDTEMDRQNIVVTFNIPAEQKVLLLEILGSEASLTFLNEVPAAQREQALKDATLLLSWNF